MWGAQTKLKKNQTASKLLVCELSLYKLKSLVSYKPTYFYNKLQRGMIYNVDM